ncbi:MAG: ABC transporter substrate-binding protein, partial [Vampirovibrionales bacterium]|nr:ABC transporter substrate-binding protein [Vampirovibrionales bacterium]
MITPLSCLMSLGVLLCFSACKPSPSEVTPKASPSTEASIIQVTRHPAPGRFTTRYQDGKSWLVSRFAVGRHGGAMTVAELGDGPKTFNPWASFDASSSSMGEALFSGLVQTDVYTGEVVPYLAESFTVSADQTEITVTLRDGLTWSDGHPLTVDDVLFTWHGIIKAGLGNPSTRDTVLVDG